MLPTHAGDAQTKKRPRALLLRARAARRLTAALTLALLGAGALVGCAKETVPTNEVWSGLASPALPMPTDHASRAPSLEQLLPGLEAKVAAEPTALGPQILLAQTYAELGRRPEALRSLERLSRKHPGHAELHYARAELLSRSADKRDLDDAFAGYDRAAKASPDIAPLARLRQGELLLRAGDRTGAVRIWQGQLARHPQSPHRSRLEAAIADAGSTGG